jgi:ABC-type amino acid transport substrate-binding protein
MVRLVALLLAIASSTIAQARYYDVVIESGFIRVGVYKDFPPYSYIENGEPAGIDVELGKAIAEKLGVRFEPHWIIPDENLEDDLRNNVWKGHYLDKSEDGAHIPKNVADLMMRVPYDKEYSYRQDISTGEYVNEMVVMFGPYQRETWQIAFDSSKIDKVSTIAKFQYHPIGVEIDSLPDFYLTSAFNGRMRDQTKHYAKAEDAYAALDRGEVTGVMSMRAEADHWLSRANNPKLKLAENGFPMIGKQKWDIGMAIRQSDRQLGNEIDWIMERMILSGEVEQLFNKLGLQHELPGLYQELEN